MSSANSGRRRRVGDLSLRGRWHWVVTAMTVLVALVLGGLLWQRREASVDETWRQVQLSGVLRVGLDASYPPFEYIDEETGEILGYDVDLARLIGDQLGVETELINSGFDGLYPSLKVGHFDCVISAFPHDALLTRDVGFSMPYFQAGLALVIRDSKLDIATVEDLGGHTLAIEWGASGDVKARELQRRLRDVTLAPYATASAALEAVAQGETDAALVDAVSAYQAMHPHPSLRIVQEGVTDESYVILVALNSPELLGAINDILDDLHDDSTLVGLRERWL
jgi:polar amino acid transport system substrate-binding protein